MQLQKQIWTWRETKFTRIIAKGKGHNDFQEIIKSASVWADSFLD